MYYELDNKVILVTGASRGLGRDIAKKLALNNASIIINYKSSVGEASKLYSEIKQFNSKCITYLADVTDEKQVKKMYMDVIKEYGKIDVLINNAGLCSDSFIQFMSYDQWDRVIKNSLYGVFLCSRIFSKCLIKNGGGKIINIASLKGQLGSEGQCNYSAAKAGVIGLTKALAKEFGPYNISVNAVCPGFAVTDLNKDNENKVMYAMEMSTMTTEYTKSDLSNFIAFLCSDAIKGVSGRIFNLDSRIM